MKKEYNPLELLRAEMEHTLLPAFFYKSDDFDTLNGAKKLLILENAVPGFYESLCEEDDIEYPYSDEDFNVEYFVYYDMNVFQIDFPDIETEYRKGQRVYLVFDVSDIGEIKDKAYFLKETDVNNDTYMLYIPEEGETLATDIIKDEKKERELLYKSYKIAKSLNDL